MSTPPPPLASFDPITGQPVSAAPAAEEQKLLAPVWHTVAMSLLMLGYSAAGAWGTSRMMSHGSGSVSEKGRIIQYSLTIVVEFLLLFLVWLGLRMKQTRIRDLIGGRWDKPEAFLIDVAIAFGFWVVAFGVLIGLGLALGLTKPEQAQGAKKLLEALAPRSVGGLMLFIVLSTVAGFVEEVIFRGYLQKQIGVITGNAYVGLLLSALIFGGSHGYEGLRRMFLIFVFGSMFGFLAMWRKSLRPGMMAHAWHDSFQGALLFIVARKGFPTLPR
jgi:membrane protease YdiL (CAAX protease family)